MNVHFSYKISKTTDLENTINQQVEKLNRYLRVFRPDLVHLKGIIAENSGRQGYGVSLNLRLPTGQMASQEAATTTVEAIKVAFESIIEQLKKHKSQLRNQHKWPRRRGPQRAIETVPFEETVAAVRPELVSSADVYSYVNANLPRLQRYVERQLAAREADGLLLANQIAPEDVIGEAIANALDEQHEHPERMKLEPWLYRLTKEAIEQLRADDGEEYNIPLEPSRREPDAHETDEPRFQFHQPDEQVFEENVIPDAGANNPEELAARRELISLVESNLREAGRSEREAFILYTIEGFTLEEVADITNHSVEEVRVAIRKGREHLQRALPIKDPLKDKLVEYARSA